MIRILSRGEMTIVQAIKILYVITTGHSGGAKTHLYELCTRLPGCFSPIVIMGHPGTLEDRLVRAGVPVHIIPSLQREISLKKDIEAYRQLCAMVRSLQPDLLCLHSSKAGILGRLAAHRLGIPAVFTAHGWAFAEGVPPLQRFFYRQIERLAGRYCQCIICVSDYDYRLARRYNVAPPGCLAVVHNGIAAEPIPSSTPHDGPRPVRIIMVARFAPQKNQLLLLEAANRLPAHQPFEIILVGDGPLLPTVQDHAARLPIAGKVHFLGNREDVGQLLRDSDIFVLSSWWEGFPITILEAMRAGLPVVASDVGGCREAVVDGQTGFLFEPGDVQTLSQRLSELTADQELRRQMGLAGQEWFITRFTADKMVEDTVKIYKDKLTGAEN